VGLGLGGELRAFHADVGATELADYADLAQALAAVAATVAQTGSPKATWPTMPSRRMLRHDEGAIDELVGDNEVGGFVLFLEGADGGDGKDALDAEGFEGVDMARKLSSEAGMRWPRPWRARNATLRPSNSPRTNGSEGEPKGVSMVTS